MRRRIHLTDINPPEPVPTGMKCALCKDEFMLEDEVNSLEDGTRVCMGCCNNGNCMGDCEGCDKITLRMEDLY